MNELSVKPSLAPRVLLLCGALLALPFAAASQEETPDLAAEVEELQRGQRQILDDLAAIRALLTPRAAPADRTGGQDVAGRTFALGDNPVRGAADAPLTLVEFTDYQ